MICLCSVPQNQIAAATAEVQLAHETLLENQQSHTVLESTVHALQEQHRDYLAKLEMEERRMDQMYVCSTCNVIITRSCTWP
jgi:uncharacterized protein with PIN domain